MKSPPENLRAQDAVDALKRAAKDMRVSAAKNRVRSAEAPNVNTAAFFEYSAQAFDASARELEVFIAKGIAPDFGGGA